MGLPVFLYSWLWNNVSKENIGITCTLQKKCVTITNFQKNVKEEDLLIPLTIIWNAQRKKAYLRKDTTGQSVKKQIGSYRRVKPQDIRLLHQLMIKNHVFRNFSSLLWTIFCYFLFVDHWFCCTSQTSLFSFNMQIWHWKCDQKAQHVTNTISFETEIKMLVQIFSYSKCPGPLLVTNMWLVVIKIKDQDIFNDSRFWTREFYRYQNNICWII